MRLRTGLLADPMLSGEATQAQEGAKFLGVSPQDYTGIQAQQKLGQALRGQQMGVGPSPHNDEAGDLPSRSSVDKIGVPLPPRRPPGIGSDGADLPRGPPGYFDPRYDKLMREAIEEERQNMARQAERRAQRQTKGMAELGELKQDYPYGAGFPETSPSFPAPIGQVPMSRLNEILSVPSKPTASEGGREWGASQDLPPEYQPDRPIPLGELQRRWGVPRLEDL